MSLFQLYLITRLDNLSACFVFICCISAVMVIVSSVIALVNSDYDRYSSIDKQEQRLHLLGKRMAKWASVVLILSSFIEIAVPDEKDVAMIIGGYYATNNEQIKQIPDNILAATNEFLKEYAKPLKDKAIEVTK